MPKKAKTRRSLKTKKRADRPRRTAPPASRRQTNESILAHDAYHSAISIGLTRPLDPDLFEACAADLLREIYPSLTPVRGGSDHGNDGLIAPPNERPFPLITTVGEKAKANLLRNLDRASKRGKKPTRAVFATSRRITPQARHTLEEAVEKRGVRWLQIFDQDWFANALYRHESWARRLLNVSGRPSALSVVPPSPRPIVGSLIIGRDAELKAIRHVQGDCLIVGAPGSGKTFLLRELTRTGEALFLADPDREALANAIRAQRPPAIIVDDAHVEPALLFRLRHLRSDLGATFRLIAVSWPADSSHVQTQLGVTSSAVIELPDIDLDTMVKIVKSVGLSGPNPLIRAVVHQSNGRPGLAATLAELCLRGDALEVWTGKSLARDLLPMLRRLAGQDVAPLLACFAIGGSTGMPIDKVAAYLGKALDSISTSLARVGTAGILRQDTSSKMISIWPDSFRWQLVRDIFFGSSGALDYKPLLAHARDIREAALSLLGAHALGAEVPGLLDHLARANSVDVWGHYASLGAQEGRYVVRNHASIALKIPNVLLRTCPEDILPSLLTAAIDDNRELHSNPEHPLRQIQDWMQSPFHTSDERIERARSLIAAVRQWWPANGADKLGTGNVAIRAFCLAFDPEWRDVEPDPGRGNTVTLSHGTIDARTIKGLRALWRTNHQLLTLGTHGGWKHIISLVSEWRTSLPNVTLPDTMVQLRRRMSKEILKDVAQLSWQHVGVQHQIRSLAHQLKHTIDTNPDRVFDLLFPFRESANWREEHARWASEAKALAPSWRQAGPAICASRIAQYEREARAMGITYPRLSPLLFESIAASVSESRMWFNALTAAQVPADLVAPFLRAIVDSDSGADTEALQQCLNNPDYVFLGAEVALARSSMPDFLVELAFKKAKAFPRLLESWCTRDELPIENLEKALRYEDKTIALAAAVGEWCSATHDQRPLQLSDAWRHAVVRSATGDRQVVAENRDYWLGKIFKADSSVALDWLLQLNARNPSDRPYELDRLSRKALAALSSSERLALLQRLDGKAAGRIVMRAFVGTDAAVYAALLARKDLADYHLHPLEGTPSPEWRCKAIAALEAGYTQTDILRATRLTSWEWTGNLSDMWKERKKAFEGFLADDDPRIAAIARRCSEETAREVNDHLKKEREEAVLGRERRRR